jgi:hypothetical protein
MTVHLPDYVASGYFLSRHTGLHDCTGIELRRVTLAHDHTQRLFFPQTWALSWCSETPEDRLAEASVFRITEKELERVMAWADDAFDTAFGAWDAFFTLDTARDAARSLLRHAHEHGLVDSFDEALAACKLIERDPVREHALGTGWLPWLLVRYPL